MGLVSSTVTVHAQPPTKAPVPAKAQPQGVGRVQGVIFDSLSSRPLEGATVFMSGSPRIGLTDARGRFEIDSVPVGKRALTYTTPSLDSLGLFTLGQDVQVSAGQMVDVNLHTPSFATVWRSLCPRTPALRGDSGIVYGSITNAANEQRLEGAQVIVSWWKLESDGKTVKTDRPLTTTKSDSTGSYYACGVAADMQLTIDIQAGAFAAGTAEVQLGASRVSRRDFLVSGEMREPSTLSSATSSQAAASRAPRTTGRMSAPVLPVRPRRHGTATLRGTVRDAKGLPVGSALITLPSADTSARSDDAGRFAIGGLPAGTQQVRVMRLGNGPLVSQVDLRPNQVLDVLFDLPPATVLAKVDVTADREISLRQLAFDERQRSGLGRYLDEAQLKGQIDVTTPLRTLPSVIVQKRGFETSVMLMRGGTACTPTIWLDGRKSSLDELRMNVGQDLYGIEVYMSAQTTPTEFVTPGFSNCGAIAAWTKLGRR